MTPAYMARLKSKMDSHLIYGDLSKHSIVLSQGSANLMACFITEMRKDIRQCFLELLGRLWSTERKRCLLNFIC